MSEEARYSYLMKLDKLSLQYEMRKLGLVQQDLAKALGVTKGAVSMGMNDAQCAHYRKEMREKIARYLAGYTVAKKHARKLRAA